MVQFPKLTKSSSFNLSPRWLSVSTAYLFSRINNGSLTFFRASFGLIMLWECWRYFKNRRIARYWIEPEFFFNYGGFGWLRPLPDIGMYLLFAGLATLAVCIMLGFAYRLSTVLFFLGFTYVFLLDKANYLIVIDSADFLSTRQQRKMIVRPDMILQFSHYLAQQTFFDNQGELIVQADVWTSLNGRSP